MTAEHLTSALTCFASVFGATMAFIVLLRVEGIRNALEASHREVEPPTNPAVELNARLEALQRARFSRMTDPNKGQRNP